MASFGSFLFFNTGLAGSAKVRGWKRVGIGEWVEGNWGMNGGGEKGGEEGGEGELIIIKKYVR